MSRLRLTICLVHVFLIAAPILAADRYFNVPLDKLEVTEGERPAGSPDTWNLWQLSLETSPYAVLDGPGEIILSSTLPEGGSGVNALLIRTGQEADITGELFYQKSEGKMAIVKFKIAATQSKDDAKEAFLRAKESHYETLLDRNIPGAAWFRYQAAEAGKALGNDDRDRRMLRPNVQPDDAEDTYSLFSGGRALSENLQLDRALAAGRPTTQPDSIDVNSIDGISIQPMDWTAKTKGLSPGLDFLATYIPADQHAVFFPSLDALDLILDQAGHSSLPILQQLRPESQDAMTQQRYERQLGVSMGALAKAVGPLLVSSVAITGSDPYLSTGSDVAILFEPKNADALQKLLVTQIRLASPGAKFVHGTVQSLEYEGVEFERSIRSYVARLGDVVVLTNSLSQLKQLANVHDTKAPSLAVQPEYIFFRDRYHKDDANESALLVLSDATIRRWCGPRWRIADSRRTRAAAVLADLQAKWLDQLADKNVATTPIDNDSKDLGTLSLTPTGVNSSVYGSLEMMTPISELSIDTVTASEAAAYKRWRDTYQQNWRQYFDPIALRLSTKQDKLAADVTVMPLIWGTDYRSFIEITQGIHLAPDAGDPHNALAHLLVAFNRKAMAVQTGENFIASMVPDLKSEALGWMGQSIALYIDDDPFWDELLKAKDTDKFMQANIARLPIGLRVEVSSGLRLAGFLVALRTYVEQTAPQMTQWQNLKYNDRAYVKITPTETAKTQETDIANVALFYAATGKSLLITPNESLLQRALDRESINPATSAPSASSATQPASAPWLGSSANLALRAKVFELILKGSRAQVRQWMQSRAWANLPILNEWKQRYPDQDPVEFHERLWHTRLVDMAGGKYVWNPKWHTMESTIYGHPGEPKDGPDPVDLLNGLISANFGLTFEDQGLRAAVEVQRHN
jgi:hypothetical protein